MPQTRISEATRERIRKLWPDILSAVAEGLEIRDVRALAGVSLAVMRQYIDSEPGARETWNTAKTDSADAYFDEVRAIAYSAMPDPHASRVKAELLRWLAAKRNKEYSDKTTLDVNVKTIDLTAIISRAQARLDASRMIEGVVVRQAVEDRSRAADAEIIEAGVGTGVGVEAATTASA